MGVFVILLIVPMLIQHCVINNNKEINFEKKYRNALLFFFLFFTLLVMLRHESVGTDTRNYIYYFREFSKMSLTGFKTKDFAWGFAYLNKIISLFTEEPQIFLAITAIITIAMIYPTYKRLCVDPSLTIVLFCIMSTFVMMFSGLRQMLAVGVGILAYECTRNKKIVLFVLCVLFAMSFHTSAFMLAFMYPIYHAKITKKWLLVVVPAIIVVFIFNRQIFSVLSIVIERYTQYDASVTQTGAYTMIFLFVVFAVFAFLIPDESLLDEETIGLRNFLLFSLILQMFAPLHTLAMRMNYYYIIFIPLLLPKIIDCKSERWSQVAVIARHVMVVFFFVYFFISVGGGGNLHVFPYHFFWERV